MRKKTLGLTALLCCGLLCRAVPVAAGESATYRVHKGDTLWEISGTHLQDPYAWPKVWKRNPKIKNPNLIKPGEVVRLPGKAKKKVKAKAKAKPSVTAQKTAPVAAMPAVDRSGPPLALTVLREGPVEKKAAAAVLTISEARGIGQVTSDLPGDGTVLTTHAGWRSDSIGGTIYVQAVDAKVGTRYGVYRDLGKVKHPSYFRWSPGHLLAEIGTVEIVTLEGERQVAKITKSYDAVREGDLLGPLTPALPPLTLKDHTAPVAATVVAVEAGRLFAAPENIVYLDAGADQGLAPGDRLWATGTEENSRRLSGVLAVLRVTPTTAAALVLPESGNDVRIGDAVGPVAR